MNDMSITSNKTVVLDELDRRFGLRKRTINVCLNNGLTDLHRIREFKREHGEFTKLLNCGRRTQADLEELLRKVEEEPLPASHAVAPEVPSGLLSEPDLEELFELLSVRAKNALTKFTGESAPEAIAWRVLFSDIDFSKIRNVGSRPSARYRNSRQPSRHGHQALMFLK